MAARRPKGFDVQCWQAMSEYQRIAEARRMASVKAAQRRFEGQSQRAQSSYNRTMRRARNELETALAAATQVYRDAESADPAFAEGSF